MTASEKLKALDERHQHGITVAAEHLGIPLPQIVEAIAWAERAIQNFDEYGEVSFIPLIDSLEELDKALS